MIKKKLMTLLLLIRHADNDARRTQLVGRLPGIHLNERGKKQAEELAQYLCKAPIQAVYSSPMERAVETALPLTQALDLPLQIEEGINETDYGEWQGRTFRQLRRLKGWQLVLKQPSQARFPGGETLIEVQQRAIASVEKLSQGREMVAVFTHADIIRLALAYYLNIPLDNYHRLSIRPASLSIVELNNEIIQIVLMNQTRDFDLTVRKPIKAKSKGAPKH
jgi:probable phosphomutase (TIGR03848 family)